MTKSRTTVALILALAALIGLSSGTMSGCESLPGDRETQGAVIGGASGAVLGAVIASENRLLGALIGGLLGAGGGYLIGAKTDWFGGDDDDRNELRSDVQQAVDKAQRDPATAEEARNAKTADINKDGFVTLDEVIAMERAGLSDNTIIKRLEATDAIFDLNAEQRRILRDNGVSQTVIDRMLDINRSERERYLAGVDEDNAVIGRER
jgi:hypothetical protein